MIFSDNYEIVNSFESTRYQKILDTVTKVSFYGKAVNSLGNEDVRISKRLFMPSSKLRGFESGKIGPTENNDYIGGNYISALNFSATLPKLLPSFQNIDFSLFIDAANVWGVDYDSAIDDNNKIPSLYVSYNGVSTVKEQLDNDSIIRAISICKNTQHPIARMIEKGIQRMDKPYEQIEKSMEQVGKLEVYQMEKNTSILSTIAGIAPMFGFLGTIAGMIILFFNIQHDGFSLEHIAGGIYTKMVTSAVGLIIGLLSYVAYNYINAQINKAVNKMEAAAADFLDTIA